jgi:hypothetical protein
MSAAPPDGSIEGAGLSPEIHRALRDAFGEQPIEGMTVLRGGRSGSRLLSFDVAGRGYVLRKGNSMRVHVLQRDFIAEHERVASV